MKFKLKFLFLLFFCTSLSQNEERKFINFDFDKNKVLNILVSDGEYKIKAYSKFIIETNFIPKGQNEKDLKKSHAVVLNKPSKRTRVYEKSNKILLKTNGISAEIIKDPFQIKYYFHGNELISEANGYQKNDSLETIDFNLKSNEILYGGGARALGMNRRGNRLELYNKANYGYETFADLMNYTMPLVVSSDIYMIHFDNAPIGFLDLDSKENNRLKYETISGRKTYQVIASKSWENLLNEYTNLTGKQPMIPRWALGNFSSRFGYHSQKEVENTIKKFEDYKIPVDAVILDLYWFGKTIKGTMGNLEVYKDSFPDFEGMISRLKKKGIKTIAITEPFILTSSKKWDEAKNKNVLAIDSTGNPYTYDFYFGHTGLIDIYNPDAELWFWEIYKDLHNKGIAGVWGDLGEPEVHPKDLIHFSGSADEVHNIYGHDWAGLVFNGYKRDFVEERPFILMRSGYSGSQRFGLIPWSGDVNRTWGGLQSQTEIALQMGIQGLGYMHSDLGGFAGANLDDELYVRWLQYGVFQPIFRPHAQEEVPSEPVYRSNEALQLSKKAIELRYSLLPYNYNLAFENNRYGLPLMRPLFFYDDSNDLKTISSSYLWGNDILVSPIIEPNKKTQQVHFPKGSNWYDYYTGTMYEGGTSSFVKTSKEYIPTFIKAGSIIPMIKNLQNTDNYSLDNLELHYYPDLFKKNKRNFYNDNGLLANAFEKEEYEIIKVGVTDKKALKKITVESKIGKKYDVKKRKIEIVIHSTNKKPKKVIKNNKNISFEYNNITNSIHVFTDWVTSKKLKIKIKTI